MVYIYVLKLVGGKYYVGKTTNPRFRLESHFNSHGSEWTRKYKPLKMVELKPNCDDYDEDKITRQYMDKYGIDNVRGGSFVSITLDDSVLSTLQQMSNGTNDRCFTCGQRGHFAKDCDEECEEEYEEVWVCEHCGKEFSTEKGALFHENVYCKQAFHESDDDCCFRCGRAGHYASYCVAWKDINGRYLS